MDYHSKDYNDFQDKMLCAPPCQRYLTLGDSHNLCMICLGEEHACSALEGARQGRRFGSKTFFVMLVESLFTSR